MYPRSRAMRACRSSPRARCAILLLQSKAQYLVQSLAQVAIRLPCSAFRAAGRFGVQFGIAFLHLSQQQPVGLPQIGLHSAEEGHRIAALDQQSGEILDIQVAYQVRLIFDVDPEETLVGMARRQFIETGAILATDVAPGRAQAGDNPDVVRQRFGQLEAVMEFYSNAGHRYI